jgi:hypothetical protein
MERNIPFFGKNIKIYQAWFSEELGASVWDSVSPISQRFMKHEAIPL